MKDVYIYDSIRTPRGKGRKDGALHEVSALSLSITAIDAIAGRNGYQLLLSVLNMIQTEQHLLLL